MPQKSPLLRRTQTHGRERSTTTRRGHSADSIAADRLTVIRSLQRLVDAGDARWRLTTNGDVHIALLSGETFLLGEHNLMRIG
jgi:hypothetical protein